MAIQRDETIKDVVLIGAGMMSATLGMLLKELTPELNITVFEKLNEAGAESSNEWNNAGTGHAALCELNYTEEKQDGTIDTSKAIKVNEQFQKSIQFWAYLVRKGYIESPEQFIRSVPHVSFVQGKDDVEFLKKRYKTLRKNPLFESMAFTEDVTVLKEWLPIMMEGRYEGDQVAATKMVEGTDVNFGALTRKMFQHLQSTSTEILYNQTVNDLKQNRDGTWEITVYDEKKREKKHHQATFVFIGGGGGSLHLLQKSRIKEGKHIGGFPVSGNFMVCRNKEVINKHYAKVYGKAKVGAPPMSVPHLDTRYIDGEKALLFGPFAGFSPRFLKEGSRLDLFTSVRIDNVLTMIAAGAKEMSLTKYLIQQLMLTSNQRMEQLREFIPEAKKEDWELVVAGQRVQVIKDTDDKGRGTLQFGTEVITSSDHSLAALLGASPGASTAVHVMLDVLERCFPKEMDERKEKIKQMVPSYGLSLMENKEMLAEVRSLATNYLQLN